MSNRIPGDYKRRTAAQRIVLTASKIFYIASTGVNAPDRGHTSALPFATRQYAYEHVRDRYDINNKQVTFQVADGTLTDTLSMQGLLTGQFYFGQVIWRGNVASPTSCVIRPAYGGVLNGARAFYLFAASCHIEGFYIDMVNADSDAITGSFAQIGLGRNDFGPNHNHNLNPSVGTYLFSYARSRIAKGIQSKTVTAAIGSGVITCADTSNLEVGMGVYLPGTIPPNAYIASIITNTSVTLGAGMVALANYGPASMSFTGWGLTHIAADPQAFIYAGTSDGGLNQICCDVQDVPRFSNGFVTMDHARSSLARFYCVSGLKETTGTFTSGTSTMDVADRTGILVGDYILHPDIPLGATVDTITPGSGTTGTITWIGGNATASATAEQVDFAASYDGNALGLGAAFFLNNNSILDNPRTFGGSSDIAVFPGATISFSATFGAGVNIITLDAATCTAIATFMNLFSGYRGLVVQGTGIASDTVIPSVSQVGATTIVISRSTASAQAGVTLKFGGFAQNDSFLSAVGDAPVALLDLATGRLPNSNLADMAQSTIKLRAAGAGTGAPIDGTVAQAQALLSQGIILGGKLIGADFNSTADQAITIVAPTNYTIFAIVVANASVSLTTAQGGVYPAAAKAGTAIVANTQAYTALTAAAVNAQGSALPSMSVTTAAQQTLYNLATLYFSLTTAQGAAATADIYVYIRYMPSP